MVVVLLSRLHNEHQAVSDRAAGSFSASVLGSETTTDVGAKMAKHLMLQGRRDEQQSRISTDP